MEVSKRTIQSSWKEIARTILIFKIEMDKALASSTREKRLGITMRNLVKGKGTKRSLEDAVEEDH